MNPVLQAKLRMSALAHRMVPEGRISTAERADLATSMTDLRTALCLALRVPLDDIHPAAGTNITFAAYERSRQSWLNAIEDTGWTEYTVRDCAAAGERWERMRPEYVEKLPWPAAGIYPDRSAEADR